MKAVKAVNLHIRLTQACFFIGWNWNGKCVLKALSRKWRLPTTIPTLNRGRSRRESAPGLRSRALLFKAAPNWSGYRLIPDVVEFWQGRPSRLHDRIQYTRTTGADWKIVRLSP